MYEIIVNGKLNKTNKIKNLLEYLRDDLDLKAAKNGCEEGACGTCTVIVDGKATKACVLKTDKLKGKKITTLEGLSQRERDVFAFAFTEAGAVQCGFCIPGMVMSATALFLKTLEPTKMEIKKGLAGNICRCTGYVKIEQAIELAAEILRTEREVPKRECKGMIGTNVHRIDGPSKTIGEGVYAEDIRIDGMYYGGAVRSEYPRAKIISIDVSEAEAMEGVLKVITAADVPGINNIGHLSFISDWDALIPVGEITRYRGDAIALVTAKDKETLKMAKKSVKIVYEELTPVLNIKESMAEDAPKVHKRGNLLFHQTLSRGNVEKAIAESKHVVTHIYKNPATEHAYLEPESATALPTKDGIQLYTSSQSIYDEQREVSRLLGLEPSQVRVTSTLVGGGFGGKEDMTVQHHAGLIAYVLQVPVQVTLSRQESIYVSTKRHAMEIEMTTACDEDGILTGMKAIILSDTGAYSSLGGPVLQRACTHASGPYNYHNIEVDGKAYYTNNSPGGAFRGFGVTQSVFATESNINELAELVGISAWEIRHKNAIRPGQVLPNGQIADAGTGLVETLEAVKEEFDKNKHVGIACAFKNAGIGVGLPDIGKCRLTVIDGKVHIRTSAACIGQGVGTVILQILCETTQIDPKNVVVETPDTHITPNSGTTTASRQTVFTGEATRVAAIELKNALEGKTLEDINGYDHTGEYSGVTDKIGIDKKNPESHIAYGYATQLVVLDDNGKIEKVVAAHDVGKAINPKSVEGQIEGGVVMGLGFALTEIMPFENGMPKIKFGTLGLLRATQVPEIKSIIIEKNTEKLAYGAKGVGEITVIPTAPAVQGAYYKFDGEFRTELPLKRTAYKK